MCAVFLTINRQTRFYYFYRLLWCSLGNNNVVTLSFRFKFHCNINFHSKSSARCEYERRVVMSRAFEEEEEAISTIYIVRRRPDVSHWLKKKKQFSYIFLRKRLARPVYGRDFPTDSRSRTPRETSRLVRAVNAEIRPPSRSRVARRFREAFLCFRPVTAVRVPRLWIPHEPLLHTVCTHTHTRFDGEV